MAENTSKNERPLNPQTSRMSDEILDVMLDEMNQNSLRELLHQVLTGDEDFECLGKEFLRMAKEVRNAIQIVREENERDAKVIAMRRRG